MERRILFITSTRIGDAALSTGALSALLTEYPDAGVTVACGPAAAALFEAVPGLERIIVMTKRAGGGHWLALWRRIALKRWEVAVDLRRSAITWLLPGAKRRLRLGPARDGEHRVRHIGGLLDRAGDPPAPVLWTSPREDAAAARLIPGAAPVLALGPTANWAAKTWRPQRFAALTRRITGAEGIVAGARVALFGAPGEREQARPLIEAIPHARRIDLIGAIALSTAAACLKRCALYIGNDSGLTHMAAAAGVPTLGLFGPSREDHYAPWGEHAAWARSTTPFTEIYPPGFDHRGGETLMDGLSVDMAENAVRALWARTGGRPHV